MSNFKKIPKFKSEQEEREFWLTHDSTDYIDWSKAQKFEFPNLKPSTKTISLRLPEGLLNDLKSLANRLDVPYQSLLKILLDDKVNEIKQSRSPHIYKTDSSEGSKLRVAEKKAKYKVKKKTKKKK